MEKPHRRGARPPEPLIDVSMPLCDRMVHWPGDPEPRIERLADCERGDACTLSAVAMSVHTGTHVDAPAHYLAGGRNVEAMPLSGLIGPARVIEITDPNAVTVAELRRHRVRRGERLLLKTANSACDDPRSLLTGYVALSGAGARWLAARGVRAVGIDGLSMDPPDADEAHLALLHAGVWIIEGLRLSGVSGGRYELLCLPLRLLAEGAPARALLRRTPAAAGPGHGPAR